MARDSSTDPLERLLAQSMASREAARGEPCPDAERLATFCERGLDAAETDRVEQHVASCGRCAELVALGCASAPAEALRSLPPPWSSRLRWRWAVPIATAATAAGIWVATTQDGAPRLPSSEPTPASTASAPPRALERSADAAAPRPESLEPAGPRMAPQGDTAASLASGLDDADRRESDSALAQARALPERLARAEGAAAKSAAGQAQARGALQQEAQSSAAVYGATPAAPVAAPPLPPLPVAVVPAPAPVAQAGAADASRLAAAGRQEQARAPQQREDSDTDERVAESLAAAQTEGAQASPERTVAEAVPQTVAGGGGGGGAAPGRAGFGAAGGRGGGRGGGGGGGRGGRGAAPIIVRSPDSAIWWRARGTLIEQSMDEGAAWTAAHTASQPIAGGVAVSADTAWFFSNAGLVVRRLPDGWVETAAPPGAQVLSIQPTSAQDGSIVLRDGRVFVTSDGGATWRAK